MSAIEILSGEGVEEEQVEEVEPEEEADLESVLTEYDPDEFVSGAVVSPTSTIPENMFAFDYDCRKYFNLCACDASVVAWSAGSVVTFYDVTTKQTWFRRSTTGGTVGAITSYRKDPLYRVAIAEAREGDREPIILLYFWPQMDIDAVLRDGTTNAYSIMDFSPDGELLASVGREPDYNITIWNWQQHKIMLRTSAFTFDVNTVLFSPYNPGQLTTGGAAHIKFWKMAATFTGLKLEGELGRFGKTEICDVLGVYPMPDEKVLSGCEWGNILVWEAGLVKVEVTQRARKRCHDAPIVQFMLSEGRDEVTTIASDGCVRAWYWDTVEQADPPEDDQFVELNPVAETCVPGAAIMSLQHQKDLFWYAQDGNGGLWTVELELDKLQCEHRKLYTCHAGAVIALVALRHRPLVLSLGADGAVHAYHAEDKSLLLRYCFPTSIRCTLYPPVEMDPTSELLMIGFSDGVIRTVRVDADLILNKPPGLVEIQVGSATTIESLTTPEESYVKLVSILKPHSAAVTQISLNYHRTLLVTCGEDSTLFMYRVNIYGTLFELKRLGFIETPNNIAYMTWKPGEERVLLLCGQVGLMMEVVLPDAKERPYEEITTFKLEFESFKETLLRKYFIRHKPFPDESDLASLDEEALKRQAEADSDDEAADEWLGEVELVVSESQLGTRVEWAEYREDGSVWCVQTGTGALLVVVPGGKDVLKYGPLPGAWCDHIRVLQFICDKRYLVLGTGNGYVRVLRMLTPEEDSAHVYAVRQALAFQQLMKKLKGRRLAKAEPDPIPRLDFEDNYYLPMHDRYTGAITSMVFTNDGKRLLTSGADGNIFSYLINFPEPILPGEDVAPAVPPPELPRVREPSTADGQLMSHEELKQKEEYDKMMATANAHKKRVRDQLAALTNTYAKLIKENRRLPCSQQLDVTLDPRPLEELEREVEEARALVQRQWAHQLERSDLGLAKLYNRNIISLDVFPFTLIGITDPRVVIKPLRQKNLSSDFYDQLDEVHKKMAEAALRQRRTGSVVRHAVAKQVAWGGPRVASFLLSLPPRPPHELSKALRNYYKRLHRHHAQHIEWQEHLSLKPDPHELPPGAAEALAEAEASIGNYLLKTQAEYVAPPGHNTQLRLCITRKQIHDNKHSFNEKVVWLREEKIRLVERMRDIGAKLQEIRGEVPPAFTKPPPPVPTVYDDLEFPENNLQVKMELPATTAGSRSGTIKGKVDRERKKSSSFPQPRVHQPRVPAFIEILEKRPTLASWELLVGKEVDLTPFETEIKRRRVQRRLYEQDMLLVEAELSVQEFDNKLKQLQRERIRVQERNQLLELHLHQLHREMIVLNRFESHEDALAARVYSKLTQVRGVQDQISSCERQVQERFVEKEQLQGAAAEVQRVFKRLVQDHKFFDFLRRIFKKKYRPPRTRDPDESSESESESSSSSEEEDEGSVDSRDIGPIRLDPTVCPEGCDRETYDQTYELRNTRHKYEQDMREQERLAELLRKDIEAHGRVLRKLHMQLERRQTDLREFMMEKQTCLNEVELTVLLRYDQIRANALEGCSRPEGLSDTIVFPETLLNKLRRRVLELQQEIRQQKARHKTNRQHLHRMEIDLSCMAAREQELRAQMRVVLARKLGKVRHVDRTLDALLKQMARRFKFHVAEAVNQDMYRQIRHWHKQHGELEQRFLKTVEHYTQRLRLAAAMQADLYPVKPPRDLGIYHGSYTPQQYTRDVVRLRLVRKQQQDQIQDLHEEIRRLKMKPLAPMPPFLPSDAPLSRAPSAFSLYKVPAPKQRRRTKYFPIESPKPSISTIGEINVEGEVSEDSSKVKTVDLLLACVDAFGLTQDDALPLMTLVTDHMPSILASTTTRYQAVDAILRKYLETREEGAYRKNTRAFDALNALVDRLVEDSLDFESHDRGKDEGMLASLAALETALEAVPSRGLVQDRIRSALEVVLQNVATEDIDKVEVVTTIVTSLLDRATELPTEEELDKINIDTIIESLEGGGTEREWSIACSIVDAMLEAVAAEDPADMAQVDRELSRPLSPIGEPPLLPPDDDASEEEGAGDEGIRGEEGQGFQGED